MNARRAVALVGTAAVSGGLWLALGGSFRVEGVSMAPTLRPGERILISRVAGIRRGDLVVFRSPRDRDTTMVKRVVAVPGDTVRFAGRRAEAPLRLEPGHYFVVGDNRGRSRDSRHFGALTGGAILGRVLFRYWPPDRVGSL